MRDLQAKWDKILADSGFEDIEPLNKNGSRNTPYLNNHSGRFASRYNASTEEYYRLASQFGWTLPPDNFRTWVWQQHAEAVSLKQLAKWSVWKNSPVEGCEYVRRHAADLPYNYLKRVINELREQFKEWISEEIARGSAAREEEGYDYGFNSDRSPSDE